MFSPELMFVNRSVILTLYTLTVRPKYKFSPILDYFESLEQLDSV